MSLSRKELQAFDRWLQARLDGRMDEPPPGGAEGRALAKRLLEFSEHPPAVLTAPPVRDSGWVTGLAGGVADAGASGPGSRAGPFEIERAVGAGGMGAVYLARRVEGGFEQRVALKILAGSKPGADSYHQFQRERQTLSRLDHPNIARLIDGGMTEDWRPWFAMDFVDGLPVDRYADEHRLGIGPRLDLFLQVCATLEYAHRQMVLHRDIKPSNILVTRDGQVKLLDFGLAKVRQELEASGEGEETQPAGSWLTPDYASPEQVRGETVTVASEVYQLGLLLYRLLCGVAPYRMSNDSPSPMEMVRIVCETAPPPPSEHWRRDAPGAAERAGKFASTPEALCRGVKGDLDNIVMAALAKHPHRRFASVAEFTGDIRRYLEHRPVRARAATRRYLLGKWLRRNWVPAAAGTVTLAALVAGTGAALWQAGQARTQAELATYQSERATAVRDFMVGLFEGASPDQRQGRDVTALELLDRGTLSMSEGMTTAPEVRAELQVTMAGVYRELGQLEKAGELVEAARTAGTDPAAAGVEAARIAHARGRFDEAETALAEVIRSPDAVVEPQQRVAALTLMARVLAAMDRKDEAETAVREAIALSSAAGEPAPLALARVHVVAGEIAFGRGDLEGAEQEMRRALALRREMLGDTHTLVASVHHDLGVIELQLGETSEAEDLFGQALAARRLLLGDEHAETAMTLKELGAVERRQGNLEAAREHYLEAAEVLRKLFPEGHPELALVLNSLALAARDQGDSAAAVTHIEEAITHARASLGDSHPTVATMLNNLASMVREGGDLTRAESIQREAVELVRESVGENHHLYGVVIRGLGSIELAGGRPEAANDHFDLAAEVFAATLGESHQDYITVLIARAETALELGRPDAAERDARRALALAGEVLPEDHPIVARAREALNKL